MSLTNYKHHVDLMELRHQARYIMNVNYVIVVKQDIDKLLTTRFVQPVKEATLLSPTMIIFKKNGKL
jgi:hypothetical protein